MSTSDHGELITSGDLGATQQRVDHDAIERQLNKDCAATALIGLIFGFSCLVGRRPIVFYFSQRWGTDGTNDGMSAFDTMWVAYPGFRRTMYQTSVVWAVTFLVQAGVTALIIASTPFDTAYDWDPILPIVTVLVAMVVTGLIARRAQRESQARRAHEGAEGLRP